MIRSLLRILTFNVFPRIRPDPENSPPPRGSPDPGISPKFPENPPFSPHPGGAKNTPKPDRKIHLLKGPRHPGKPPKSGQGLQKFPPRGGSPGGVPGGGKSGIFRGNPGISGTPGGVPGISGEIRDFRGKSGFFGDFGGKSGISGKSPRLLRIRRKSRYLNTYK